MMSSTKGGKKPSGSGTSGSVPHASLHSTQDDGWEVYAKKSKNKAGSSGTNQYAPQNSTGNAWGVSGQKAWNTGGSGRGSLSNTDSRRPSGRGIGLFTPPIPPALQHGLNWSAIVAKDVPGNITNNQILPAPEDVQTVDESGEEDVDNEDDMLDDTDDELLSDGFDSDGSEKSLGTRKKNPWFKDFFDGTENLGMEELNDPERQWHCPACKGGPGAIDWYRGLQPLLTHAKTRRSKRTKLHREFANLLEEDLHTRGTSVVRAGESYGNWNGISEKDFEIVWPPMVIIMNTRLEKDDNDKWTGMGNQELVDYFQSYAAVRARHSYGPQGHRGMSVLIFEASAVGYLEAERLSKHFTDTGRDREAWLRNPILFYAGGKRQLYGYMAGKKDLDTFNQHSPGKTKLKFEMSSHLEMVVKPMKQMSEDNQQLLWYKNKAEKHHKQAKALEESFLVMGEKYRQTAEQNKIVLSRTKTHHEQNQEEMEYLDWFIKEKLESMHAAKIVGGANNANRNSVVDDHRRAEQLAKYFESLGLEKGDFVERKQKLMEANEELKRRRQAEEDEMKRRHQAEEDEMKRRHREEEVAAEEGLNAALASLMDK